MVEWFYRSLQKKHNLIEAMWHFFFLKRDQSIDELKETALLFIMNRRDYIMNDSFHTITHKIVVFTLDQLSYAFFVHAVVRVIHAIEIRHLPKAPEIIIGIINVMGRIIPVADIRQRFGLVVHEIDQNDRLIIADTGKRQIAILVDSVTGIRDLTSEQLSITGETLPFAGHIGGVAKIDDELVLIYDLEQFLSLDEEQVLEHALKRKNNER